MNSNLPPLQLEMIRLSSFLSRCQDHELAIDDNLTKAMSILSNIEEYCNQTISEDEISDSDVNDSLETLREYFETVFNNIDFSNVNRNTSMEYKEKKKNAWKACEKLYMLAFS